MQSMGQKVYGDVKTVADRYDCHPSTIWRMVKRGQLPKPVKIGNLTRWELNKLDAADAEALAQTVGVKEVVC